MFVALVSQGPEAIRKIPDIPGAISETIAAKWQAHRIDQELTGTWDFVPKRASGESEMQPVRLVLESKNCRLAGEVHSVLVKKWTPWETAFVEGHCIEGVLQLDIYEYIYGERTSLAGVVIRFQEEPNNGISDHDPPLVNSELEAKTTWQMKPALPSTFTLVRTAK